MCRKHRLKFTDFAADRSVDQALKQESRLALRSVIAVQDTRFKLGLAN